MSYPVRFRRLTLFVSLALGGAAAGCSDDGESADRDADAADGTALDSASDVETDTASDVDVPEARPGCENPGTEGATARCLVPTLAPEHYIEQALAYFDTLDVDADRSSIPDYSPLVARWEWPPWLLLTAIGAEDMIGTADSLRSLDPSTVPERDCRFFDEQPFARCYIDFEYAEGRCPIYEEFVFNDAGQVTFIEAWSDLPGMLPMDREADMWAEGPDVSRLSTRVPGLGTADGLVALETDFMRAAAALDADVADFALRASDWRQYWFDLLRTVDPDFFAIGCDWEIE